MHSLVGGLGVNVECMAIQVKEKSRITVHQKIATIVLDIVPFCHMQRQQFKGANQRLVVFCWSSPSAEFKMFMPNRTLHATGLRLPGQPLGNLLPRIGCTWFVHMPSLWLRPWHSLHLPSSVSSLWAPVARTPDVVGQTAYPLKTL